MNDRNYLRNRLVPLITENAPARQRSWNGSQQFGQCHFSQRCSINISRRRVLSSNSDFIQSNKNWCSIISHRYSMVILCLSQDNTDTFDQNVARMELQFTTLLTDLLHKISELGHANYDSHMLTLTNRFIRHCHFSTLSSLFILLFIN